MSGFLDPKYELDIGLFQKLSEINRGAAGTVYKVKKIKPDGEIIYMAAKTLNYKDNSDETKEMINREISILSKCNHQTIIKFYGYSYKDFDGNQKMTIFMELAENGSLKDFLKKAQLGTLETPYTNTLKQIIIAGVCYGLKYLHDKDIFHRDVKTDNILLDKRYYPLITDFGLSKDIDIKNTLEQSRYGVGTFFYMAPEILSGDSYDRKADVYAFAIVMYEIVTLSTPYEKELPDPNDLKKIRELTNNIIESDYRPKFECPVKEQIKKLIERCWKKDKNDRPTFDEIFRELTNRNKDGIIECCLDDVNDDYLDYIDEILVDDEENLKNDLSINEFNSIDLRKKQKILSKIISDSTDLSASLRKIQKFMGFLVNFYQLKILDCFNLETINNENMLKKIEKFQIQLNSEVIEFFFQK